MPTVLACLAVLFTAQSATETKDQTTAEFRAYAKQKSSGLSDRKIDAIVDRVDADKNGIITAEEFAKRLEAFREVKSEPEPWHTSLKEARAEANESGKPLLIFARADWCLTCERLEKHTLPLQAVQRSLAGYVLLKLDVTDAFFAKETQAIKITAVPVMIVESRGKEVAKSLEAIEPKPLVAWLDKHRPTTTTNKLRILTYNIHHGAGVDGQLDLERIAKVILSAKPDIVALQEVDRLANRSGNVDQAKRLAELTKMKFAFGPNIKLGDGDYGNAVLSRFPIKVLKNHKLPNIDGGEQRGVLDVDVQTPTGTLRLLATHFDHRKPNAQREASAEFINELLRQRPGVPTVLAGDLNAVPNSKPLTLLAKYWTRPATVFPTIPVKSPTRQIDFVLTATGTNMKFVESKVLEEHVASDHRPLLVVITVANQQRQNSEQ